jgi:tRNA G18 (ribose-2'-O)-methylase SpoU
MRKLTHEEILSRRLTTDEARTVQRHPVSIMLDNVRSLYNVGSIFRTADSALAGELILCGFTPHPPRPEIEKTALGAVDTVPWRYHRDIIDAVREQKQKGQKVVAVEITENNRPYDTLEPADFPLCMVFGNELVGLDDAVLAACDDSIEIPMYGVKHSLNVGVAVGVAAFEAVRAYRSFNN